MLECASRHETDPASHATIKETSSAVFKDLADWTRAYSGAHGSREAQLKAKHRKRRLLNRMAMSTFGGLTLIVPMLIMVLDTRRWTTVVTTSVFTLVIGLALAFWMSEADSKDMIAATAAYAAVLVVFVGASTP
jgi:VIT1/CCC1 family predicted Fe2+/Mn2+ transporter